jgi:hypothetical protein
MNTLSKAGDREDFAGTVTREFHPIVSKLGFGSPRWDYDEELDIVRVQFEDPKHENAVQIDYSAANDSYSANYCRNEGEWQICTEGKPRKLRKLKDMLTVWLLKNCEDCCVDCEPAEALAEDDYSTIRCHHCDDSGQNPRTSPG